MSTSTADRPDCRGCGVGPVVRNGSNSAGTRCFRCNGCDRRFVADPHWQPVSDERRALVERLLSERLGLRAIARVTGLSRSWLWRFVNALYRDQTPHDPGPHKKSRAG